MSGEKMKDFGSKGKVEVARSGSDKGSREAKLKMSTNEKPKAPAAEKKAPQVEMEQKKDQLQVKHVHLDGKDR